MQELGLIMQLFSWRLKQLLFRRKNKKVLERTVREDCYLDECTILGNEIISLKNKIIHIDYNSKKKTSYQSIDELLNENKHYDSIIDKAFTKNIGKYVLNNFPNSLIYVKRLHANKFAYECHIISIDSFIKIFTDSSIRERIEDLFKDSLGVRYTGATKMFSESVHHYIGATLKYDNKFVEHDQRIEFYSNFDILLKMLNKEAGDVFDLYVVNKQFIEYVEGTLNISDDDCRAIFDVVVGDQDLEKFVCFNEILK